VCAVEDIWAQLVGKVLRAEGDKEASAAALLGPKGQIALMLDELEKNIKGPFAVGATPTVADIYLFAAVGWWTSSFFTTKVNAQTILASRPKLASILASVGKAAAVRDYYSKTQADHPMWAPYRKLCNTSNL